MSIRFLDGVGSGELERELVLTDSLWGRWFAWFNFEEDGSEWSCCFQVSVESCRDCGDEVWRAGPDEMTVLFDVPDEFNAEVDGVELEPEFEYEGRQEEDCFERDELDSFGTTGTL